MRSLTKKDKAMADAYLADPKTTKTQAFIKTHNVQEATKPSSLYTQASEAFRKPEVMTYLATQSNHAQNKLVEIMNYSSEYGKTRDREGASYANVAVTAAKDVLDRVHGKATQRTEVHAQVVTLDLDVSDLRTDKS